MKGDCEAILAGCLLCLRYNVGKRGYHPARGLHAVGPWDHVCIDIGTIPVSAAGFCKLLVIVCVATRFIVLRAMRDETAVAEAGVKLSKKLIKQVAGGRLGVWERFVGVAQFGLNCRISSAHRSAPFSLMFIRPALLIRGEQKGADIEAQADEGQAVGQADNEYIRALERADIWEEKDFLDRAKAALEGIYPEVSAGMARRRDKRNLALDRTRRVVEEMQLAGYHSSYGDRRQGFR